MVAATTGLTYALKKDESIWIRWWVALDMLWYRVSTKVHALFSLATMGSTDMKKYMESYKLFDGDWSNNNGKTEDHILDYYKVINHLCALGNVEKMYIPPLRDPKASLIRNQELFELKMMEDINMKPDQSHGGKRIMEIGCGRGRISMHTARATGAHVSAFNIDPTQLANARSFAKRIRIEDQVDFKQHSLNDHPLPYPDECFDAGYQVQAFTYTQDKASLYAELYRVLKPGARFSYLDWVLLDNYDPKNPAHVDSVEKTMPFIGAVDTVHYSEIEKAMKNAGFTIVLSEDSSIGGHQGPLINSERANYAWIRTFAKYFLPARFMTMLMRLRTHAEAFVYADAERIATTSYHIVCEKPKK